MASNDFFGASSLLGISNQREDIQEIRAAITESAREKYTKERILHEMNTQGDLQKLRDKIVMEQQMGKELNQLKQELAGDVYAADVIEKVARNANVEDEIREWIKNHPAEAEQLIRQYEENPALLYQRVQAGEIAEEEATVIAQNFLEKHPSVIHAAKTLGLPLAAVAAAAAGVLIKTGKIPQSTGEFLWGMTSSAEGLFHFKVTARASEKMKIAPASLRAVYSVNATEFVRIIELCEAHRNDSGKLEELRKNASGAHERRILNMYIKGDFETLLNLQKIKNTVERRKEDALHELDKTFRKQALQQGLNVRDNDIRGQSLNFFRENITVGKMMELLYSLREDRETLLSYTAASLAYTLPKGMKSYTRLQALQNILKKERLTQELSHLKGAPIAQMRRTAGTLAEEAAVISGRASRTGAEGLHQAEAASKGARRMSMAGKTLRLAGPAAIIGSEFYNFHTGRSTAGEAVGRMAGGFLRMVPVVGTGLDFSEAISGTDQLNGQKLQDSERLARVGWGVVGLISDVALLIPFAGPLLKSAAIGARAASMAKWTRRAGLGVGLGAGVAPLAVSESGREAVGAGVSVAAGTASATVGAMRLISGPEGGAGDMMVAQARMKQSVKEFGSTVQETAKAGVEKVKSASERFGEFANSLRGQAAGNYETLKSRFSREKGGDEAFFQTFQAYDDATLTRFFSTVDPNGLDLNNPRALREAIEKQSSSTG